MFSNVMIALFVAGPFGVWVYTKMLRQTGGNNRSALIGAFVSGGVAFLVIVTLVGMLSS